MNFNYTDLGNAERFVAQHGNDVRYVMEQAEWLVWKGGRWLVDKEGFIARKAMETARSILDEAKDPGANRADVVKHWMRSESEPRIRAAASLASNFDRVVVSAECLDADPFLLGLPNGVLDLRTGELREARREDLITKHGGAPFDPDATAPRWKAYLDRVMGGNEQLQDYIQRAVGYTLTGETGEQGLFFAHGPGANGKTIFLSTIGKLLGQYAAHADFSTFLEKRNDGPRTDLARLQGARFVSAVEASEGRRLNEGVVQQLTGEDVITARKLYKEEFEFRPQFKLWFAANHKPIIRGTTISMWRRLHLIPFTVIIPPDERDPDLKKVLETELAGILNWAVEGCQLWLENGLRPPDEVRLATEEYRQESDTVGHFIEECCFLHPDASIGAGELYSAYKEWAEKAGEPRMSSTAFGNKLNDRGIVGVKKGTVRRVGICLALREARPNLDSYGQSNRPNGISSIRVHEGFSQTGLELSTTVQTPKTEGV